MEEENYLKFCASSGSPCTEMTCICSGCEGVVTADGWEGEPTRIQALMLSTSTRAPDRLEDAGRRMRS